MPRLSVIIPALFLFATVAGVGGFFLLRPPEPKRPPVPEQPNPPRPAGPDARPDAPGPGPEGAKLVVLVVFDQMRGDYLTRWAELYGPNGFERIKRDGAWFSECHIPYACTSTGPGHASLSTGAPPSAHGIIENEWHDRATGTRMYCCQPKRPYDLVPPVPPGAEKPGRGSATGFSPERLLAQTVADSLREATAGKGRTFSLSVKDRTAVLMGGQAPAGAYCFDARDGRFHTSAFYGRDAEHAWVKEFNDARPADAWFDATWDRSRPDVDYTKFAGPDAALGEADGFNGQGRAFPHALKGKLTGPAKKYYDALEGSPYGNDLLLGLAKKAVTAEKLGAGGAADLLCVSFSSNDLIGHRWGPDSHEVLDVTLRSDKLVGDLLTFLDETVGKGRYVVVIAADHGVCPLPEQKKYPAAERVMVADLVAGLDKALDAAFGPPAGPKGPWFEAFDGDVWPWVYLNQAALKARGLAPEKVAGFAAEWLAGRGYVEAAYTRRELEDKDFPADKPFKKMAALAYRPDRCGDVLVIPKAGVLVTPYAGGTGHGSPQPYDAHIPFLVYGAGVPPLGRRAERVSSLSIAPTLAWALGIPAPKDAAADRPAPLPAKK